MRFGVNHLKLINIKYEEGDMLIGRRKVLKGRIYGHRRHAPACSKVNHYLCKSFSFNIIQSNEINNVTERERMKDKKE